DAAEAERLLAALDALINSVTDETLLEILENACFEIAEAMPGDDVDMDDGEADEGESADAA
ncbi:MAG: hypothetical protein ACRDD1_00500, partial [Planctomycetia bacterium]